MTPRSGRALGLSVALLCPLALSGLGLPQGARAQSASSGSVSDVELLTANAVVAGVVAGLLGRWDGRPFWPTIGRGAVGGAIMFAGKRIAASDRPWSGFAARQISAMGASIARNAAFGSGLLDTLIVPVGPVRLHVSVEHRRVTDFRVDLEEVAWAAYGLASDRFEFDASETFRTGAIAFTAHEPWDHSGQVAFGRAAPGTVFLARSAVAENRGVRTHELVHVTQIDYLKLVLGLPLEGWLSRRAGWTDWGVLRHLDLGVGYYPLAALPRSPLEHEAESLEPR